MYARVRFHEVDPLGHVNNAAYLNYLEQAAIDHATTSGLDLARLQELGGVFVARRHEIDFLQPAVGGDLLRVVTWLGAPRGARIERRSRILREDGAPSPPTLFGGRLGPDPQSTTGSLIVQAVTTWVFVNERGLPSCIPAAVYAAFDLMLASSGNDRKEQRVVDGSRLDAHLYSAGKNAPQQCDGTRWWIGGNFRWRWSSLNRRYPTS